ncbi:MAG: HAMP domain-containing histidine kinase, partial [Acidobacteria bacterium]|nr:HAMP domain-containing histidine kinase [Acidobacteriota bacterium]
MTTVGDADSARFDPDVWTPALATYGATTHLTVAIYDGQARLRCEPLPATPLHALFAEYGYQPSLFVDCARRCLDDGATPGVSVMHDAYGIAAVGTPLRLDGAIVGAAVAGYSLVDFPQTLTVERLARDARVPFQQLWDVARKLAPVSERRLCLQGEMLQVLGDTIVRAADRLSQLQDTAAELTVAAAAKDDFLSVLSHELRTPLTPIIGWARLLKTATDPLQIAHAADVIERNARLQIRLVDDLLELNRATRDKVVLRPTTLELHEVVGSALDAFSDAVLTKHLAVHVVPAGHLLRLQADSDRLQQVFRNLLSNAVKFTPHRGTVTVTLSQDHAWGVVTVDDTGDGIAAEFMPFLFDLFRQQDE